MQESGACALISSNLCTQCHVPYSSAVACAIYTMVHLSSDIWTMTTRSEDTNSEGSLHKAAQDGIDQCLQHLGMKASFKDQ